MQSEAAVPVMDDGLVRAVNGVSLTISRGETVGLASHPDYRQQGIRIERIVQSTENKEADS